MGNFKRIIAAAVLLGMSSVVAAVPMTWEDSYSPGKVYMNSDGNNYESWTFDITNDGFNPGSDVVYNYGINLSFKDDGWDWIEKVFFDQPGVFGDKYFEVNTGNETAGASLFGLISINLDGMLDVALTATKGDFYFKGATLEAFGYAKNVPEPGTLALLGLGLAGLGAARRRKAR